MIQVSCVYSGDSMVHKRRLNTHSAAVTYNYLKVADVQLKQNGDNEELFTGKLKMPFGKDKGIFKRQVDFYKSQISSFEDKSTVILKPHFWAKTAPDHLSLNDNPKLYYIKYQ